jgi:hypothetical protein
MGTKGWTVSVVWVAWAVLFVVAIYRMLGYRAPQLTPGMAYVLVALSVFVAVAAIGGLLAATPPLGGASLGHAVAVVVAVATTAVLVSALCHRFIGYGTEAPPAFITDVTDPAQFDSVLAYAHRIPYDSMTHSGADSALLTDADGHALDTVTAWIAPALHANFNSYRDLEGSGPRKGRVVARIRVNATAGGGGYRPLNLPAGVSYVWVDNLKLEDTTGSFRALIIPDRPGGRVIPFPISPGSRYHYRSKGTVANFPMARWVLYHSNCINVPCSKGCCQSCP